MAAPPAPHRTVTARLLTTALAAGLAGVVGVVGGCAGEGVMRPTLGEPRPSSLMIYQPPPGSRFDFVVYVPNADRRMEERADRLSWVRGRVANRCTVAAVTDLYAHGGGSWPDGRQKVYFAVGVTCIPRVVPPAGELAPRP